MGTYGEYIKTKAAKAESDSLIRRDINNNIKRGYKLVKYKIGKPESLEYGRAVIMYTKPANPDIKRIHPKYKDYIIVNYVDYGVMARGYLDAKHRFMWKLYQQNAAAEKMYRELINAKLGYT